MCGHSRLLGGMSSFGHICIKDREDSNDRIANVRWPVKLHLMHCNSDHTRNVTQTTTTSIISLQQSHLTQLMISVILKFENEKRKSISDD